MSRGGGAEYPRALLTRLIACCRTCTGRARPSIQSGQRHFFPRLQHKRTGTMALRFASQLCCPLPDGESAFWLPSFRLRSRFVGIIPHQFHRHRWAPSCLSLSSLLCGFSFWLSLLSPSPGSAGRDLLPSPKPLCTRLARRILFGRVCSPSVELTSTPRPLPFCLAGAFPRIRR